MKRTKDSTNEKYIAREFSFDPFFERIACYATEYDKQMNNGQSGAVIFQSAMYVQEVVTMAAAAAVSASVAVLTMMKTNTANG